MALNLRMRVLEGTANTGVERRTILTKEKAKAREEKCKLNELWEDTNQKYQSNKIFFFKKSHNYI